jgi:hypothetical protein
MPARSAMRKNPNHSVSVPNMTNITSTDSLAIANRLSIINANTVGSLIINQRQLALIAAMRKKPNQSMFNMLLALFNLQLKGFVVTMTKAQS